MMLAYYRNNLIHLFINDAEVACTMIGFNSIQDISKGISLDALWPRVCYIRDILSDEFVLRKTLKTKEDLEKIAAHMDKRNFLTYDKEHNMIMIDPKNEN